MTMQPFSASNPFLEIDAIENDPFGMETIFQSLRPQNLNPVQSRQFTSLFQPTFQNFLGELGSQIRSGGVPDTSFNDFLQGQFGGGGLQRQLLQFDTGQRSPGKTNFRF